MSLLSFSFTLYKVLEALQQKGRPLHPNAPLASGLFLAGMGVLAMAMGLAQHAGATRYLPRIEGVPRFIRAATVMGLLMLVIGIALFIGIAVRGL